MSIWYSITSRGTRPSIERISSPTARPACSAGDAAATETTRGAGTTKGYLLCSLVSLPVRHGVLLAAPRGFCAGVEMAIKALAWMVRVFEPPVYCYHEIVHNRHVVEQFRAQGVIFVDDVAEVPAGAPLMLSAHGSAPQVVTDAREHDRVVVNAVCPLVTKVHHELKVQGPRRLHGALRRPRGPRGGHRHDGRRSRLGRPRPVRRATSTVPRPRHG